MSFSLYADGYDSPTIFNNIAPQQSQGFNPNFLRLRSPLPKVFDLSEPQASDIKVAPLTEALSATSVFKILVADRERFFNPTITAQDLSNCVEINLPPLQSKFATFLSEIKIKEMCAKDSESTHWFLKEVSRNNLAEIENLLFLNKNRKIFLSFPNDIKFFLPDYFYSYIKQGLSNSQDLRNPRIIEYNLPENRDYFYFIKAAPGLSLATIFKQKNYSLLQTALKDFAKSMAFFHQHFMDFASIPKTFDRYYAANYFRTIIHNDAHWGNVFYEAASGSLSFIDNESIIKSTTGGEGIIIEMNKLLFYSASSFGNCNLSTFNNQECKISIDAGIYFLKNYVSNYPLKYQPVLKEYLYTLLVALNRTGVVNKFITADAVTYWEHALKNWFEAN